VLLQINNLHHLMCDKQNTKKHLNRKQPIDPDGGTGIYVTVKLTPLNKTHCIAQKYHISFVNIVLLNVI
jgi:hypothetical protein